MIAIIDNRRKTHANLLLQLSTTGEKRTRTCDQAAESPILSAAQYRPLPLRVNSACVLLMSLSKPS